MRPVFWKQSRLGIQRTGNTLVLAVHCLQALARPKQTMGTGMPLEPECV